MRSYNIGTECYGLLTSTTDPEFLLPVKIIILEKYNTGNNMTYKVKIRDILENDFDYVKEHLPQIRALNSLKSDTGKFVKKSEIDNMTNKTELLTLLNDKPFFLEDNYITLDKDGIRDLYVRFMKYMINYHFEKLYQLMSRSFISNMGVYENQKNMFLKRVDKLGFGDMFKKIDLELEF